jgi:hypothetical protein
MIHYKMLETAMRPKKLIKNSTMVYNNHFSSSHLRLFTICAFYTYITCQLNN